MAQASKKSRSIIATYHNSFQQVISQKKIFIPFIVFAFLELGLLFLLYVAPRQPFINFMGQPIRAFWGERFLHYPANFLLLPKLASYARNFLSLFLGPLTTGLAVFFVFSAYNNKNVRFFQAIKAVSKKYLSLFAVVLLVIILFQVMLKLTEIGITKTAFSGKGTLFNLAPRVWLGPIMIALNLLVVVFIQGIFVYAAPMIIIANERLVKAIAKAFILFFKLFMPTIVVIVLPLLVYVPVIVLQYNTPFLINKVVPEAVVYVCIIAVIVNALIVDLLITVATTNLYLQNKDLV